MLPSPAPSDHSCLWCIAKVVTVTLIAAQSTWAIDSTSISCVAPIAAVSGSTNLGQVLDLRELPGGGVLIQAQNGLFLARGGGGKVSLGIAPGTTTMGNIFVIRSIPGVGVLIGAQEGWFVARTKNGELGLEPVFGGRKTGRVIDLRDLAGAGVAIQAQNGLFLARVTGGKIGLEYVADIKKTGRVTQLRELPGAGMLIWSAKGLFLARMINGKISLNSVGHAKKMGKVLDLQDLPGMGVLIGAEKGLFLARAINGKVRLNVAVHATTTGHAFLIRELPQMGVLVWTDKGLFFVRVANGQVSLDPAFGTTNIGNLYESHELPGAGLLVGAQDGLFLARMKNGEKSLERADRNTSTGGVYAMREFPGPGVLIGAENGLFLARTKNGNVSVDPALGNATTGGVFLMGELPGAGVLVGADKGLFLAIYVHLETAIVDLTNQKVLNGSPLDTKLDRNFDFTIEHPCASILEHVGLAVKITEPDGQVRSLKQEQITRLQAGNGKGQVSLRLLTDKPGIWKIQFLSVQGGIERQIGTTQEVSFESRGWQDTLIALGWWLGVIIAFLLLVLNVALFIAARRLPWAWRAVTDDSFGMVLLRFVTIALSYLSKAQIWVVDLYFQKRKTAFSQPPPFLALPMENSLVQSQLSDKVIAPPWKGKRIWIQGNSGMGKTALFNQATWEHFDTSVSAFEAFAKWGCIVIAFAARDFADGGGDKFDPGWVIEGVRGTLAKAGLTFEDDKLLKRILRSGTLAVAIDGLHEAGRSNAVEAFARTFDAAPMLVTSQESAGQQFETWRLPADMRDFIHDLLRLHLSKEDSDEVMNRITLSGLKTAIRSGYDVRLIIDLAKKDPKNYLLPSDRVGLYAAVVNIAWPEATAEVKHEQQMRIAAAAWRMVSERGPHEDIRRLKPDVDLEATLLATLADVQERHGRSISLVRRVGGAFIFVHEQMHAYLAARWFAQDGFGVTELEKMIAGSIIWTHSLPARHTLWSFVAALLDDSRLTALWERVEDREEWDALRRELKKEAGRRLNCSNGDFISN